MTSSANRTTFDYIMTSTTNIILSSANITTSSVKYTDGITEHHFTITWYKDVISQYRDFMLIWRYASLKFLLYELILLCHSLLSLVSLKWFLQGRKHDLPRPHVPIHSPSLQWELVPPQAAVVEFASQWEDQSIEWNAERSSGGRKKKERKLFQVKRPAEEQDGGTWLYISIFFKSLFSFSSAWPYMEKQAFKTPKRML